MGLFVLAVTVPVDQLSEANVWLPDNIGVRSETLVISAEVPGVSVVAPWLTMAPVCCSVGGVGATCCVTFTVTIEGTGADSSTYLADADDETADVVRGRALIRRSDWRYRRLGLVVTRY